MRVTKSDDGAAATIVVVLLSFGMVLGLGGVVLDYGAVYAERRQLQNGAEAAALALAGDCAADESACDDSEAAAAPWVSNNNSTSDGVGSVFDVCRAAAGVMGPCASFPGAGALTECLPPDSGAQASWTGFIEVRAETDDVPALMGKVFGPDTKSAGACARAAWGPVGAMSTIPLTISYCEWLSMTADGTDFAPAPEPDGSYPGGYPTSYERALHTHQGASGSAAGTCNPGGAYSDMPGGFGWLAPDGADCEAYYEAGVPASDPGAGIPMECRTSTRSSCSPVKVLRSSDERLLQRDGYEFVWSEFGEYAHDHPDESVTYRRGGEIFDATSLAGDPATSGTVSELSRRMQSFRAVDVSGRERCLDSYGPAR